MATLALLILTLASIPILFRLVKGPTIADRVAAFDVLTCAVMGLIAIYAIKTGSKSYIDVVLTMSFVVFMGAVAFAYFLRKRNDRTGDE
jgi:multicomponent Na+:H+ antiporter subunit F